MNRISGVLVSVLALSTVDRVFESWYIYCNEDSFLLNRISGVLVSVLASNAVDRGLKPWSGQT